MSQRARRLGWVLALAVVCLAFDRLPGTAQRFTAWAAAASQAYGVTVNGSYYCFSTDCSERAYSDGAGTGHLVATTGWQVDQALNVAGQTTLGSGSNNYFVVSGASGAGPSLSIAGSETNVTMNLAGKGSGFLNWNNGAFTSDSTGNGTFAGTLGISGAVTIGSSGTSISKSVGTNVTATAPTSVGCADTTAALTGAAAGALCSASPPAAADANVIPTCFAQSTGNITLKLCCVPAVCTTASRAYVVRVWNP